MFFVLIYIFKELFVCLHSLVIPLRTVLTIVEEMGSS